MRLTSENPVRTVVIVILVLTFPIWIGIAGGIIGLVFGLIGGAFGLVFGLIGAIFDLIFHPWHGHGWHFHHFNGFWFFVGLIVVVLLVRSRRTAR